MAFFILAVGFIFLGNSSSDNISTSESIWFKVIALFELVAQFSLMNRRLHDMGNDETLAYVIVALNVVNVIALYILFDNGTKGLNKYDADARF